MVSLEIKQDLHGLEVVSMPHNSLDRNCTNLTPSHLPGVECAACPSFPLDGAGSGPHAMDVDRGVLGYPFHGAAQSQELDAGKHGSRSNSSHELADRAIRVTRPACFIIISALG